MQCELDADIRNELSNMAYRRWSNAVDVLEQVRKEKNDNSPDWQEFHKDRLKNAEKELELATRIKNAICKYSPLLLGR